MVEFSGRFDIVYAMAERILLVRLSALGDVAHVMPALAALRAARPDAKIGLVTETAAFGLAKDHPQLDAWIEFPRKRMAADARSFSIGRLMAARRDFLDRLRSFGAEIALDFQGNLRSALVAYFSGARKRIGFAAPFTREMSGLFYTARVAPAKTAVHKIARNLELLRALGIAEPADYECLLPRSGAAEKSVAGFLGVKKPSERLVVMHPAVSRFGSYKGWPPENFGRLAGLIADRTGAKVAITRGPGEEWTANAVVQASMGRATLAPETDLAELLALIRAADLFVGLDSGPLHIAALLKKPVVALYGPKDPRIYGPLADERIVIEQDMPCRPCRKRTCPDPKCMLSITPETVMERAGEFIDRTAGG